MPGDPVVTRAQPHRWAKRLVRRLISEQRGEPSSRLGAGALIDHFWQNGQSLTPARSAGVDRLRVLEDYTHQDFEGEVAVDTSATPLMSLKAVALDTETTGLDARTARIIEIALLRIRGLKISSEGT